MAWKVRVLSGDGGPSIIRALLFGTLLFSPGRAWAGAADLPVDQQQSGTKMGVPELNVIVAGLRHQNERLQSLAIDYTIETELLDEPQMVRRYLGLEYLAKAERTFAFQGNKRFYSSREPKTVEPLAPDVEPAFDVVPGETERKRQRDAVRSQSNSASAPRTLSLLGRYETLYNGSRLYQRSGDIILILEFSRLHDIQDDRGFFKTDYLSMTGRALPDLSPKQNDRRSERLHEALATEVVSTRPEIVEENGHPCVVVERARKEVIWLDPALNFAVRRWEGFDPETGMLLWRISHREFTEAEPGLWLPKVTWWDRCGAPRAPESYRGKPMARTILTVRYILVNNVPDGFFTMFVEPGCQINDSTLLPPKDGREQIIRFAMPAYPETLDATVDKVLAQPRQAAPQDRFLWSIGLVSLSVLAGVGLFLATRSYLGRRVMTAVQAAHNLCPTSGGPT